MEGSAVAAQFAKSVETDTPKHPVQQLSPQQQSHLAKYKSSPRALRPDGSPYTKPSRAHRKSRNRA